MKKRIVPDWGLAMDDARRLRNALIALAGLDVGWMAWVERHVPAGAPVHRQRILVERQARLLVARRHTSIMAVGARLQLVYSDYYFTDDGVLKAYL